MSNVEQPSTTWRWAVAVAAVTIAGLVGLNFWQRHSEPEVAPQPQVTAPTATPTPAPEPPIEHPLPPPPSTAPALPALTGSDTLAQQALADLVGSTVVRELFNTDHLIRRIVVTVDNLPRPKLALRQLPLKPVGGSLAVTQSADATLISPDNAQRYGDLVRLVAKLDMRQVAAAYQQFYPLFQNAYVDLGYPKGYFNDRLIAVIDHLLATPEPTAPLALAQPKVLYEYADPDIEARSAGQKILLRMGPGHARHVKAKLRELRAQISTKPNTVQ